MRYKIRRDVKASSDRKDAALSALIALQNENKREHTIEYIESMIDDLANIAVLSEEKFIAYLLNLAREEARSAKSRASWQASAA
jgi:hypothetical protein